MELAPVVKLGISDGTTNAEVSSNFTVAKKSSSTSRRSAGRPHGLAREERADQDSRGRDGDVPQLGHHRARDSLRWRHPARGRRVQSGHGLHDANVTDDATWYCHIHGGDSA